MHRPGPVVLRRVLVALAVGVLVQGTAGCGSTVEGQAVRTKPDLSTLSVGNYPTEPKEYGTAPDYDAARTRESQRLADHVILPYEAVPALNVHTVGGEHGPVVLDSTGLSGIIVNDTFNEVTKDLVAGWVNSWYSSDSFELQHEMDIAVMMFPDPATAETVANQLEHDDFTFNTDNRPVALPGFPRSRAHWRPGTSSLGSWTSHDRYVVFILYRDASNTSDLPALVSATESALKVQLPLLDQFRPTPAELLKGIRIDPTGLLAVTLPQTNTVHKLIGPPGAYKGRGAVYAIPTEFMSPRETDLVTEIAVGGAVVARAESAVDAETLWNEWRPRASGRTDVEIIDTPGGIDGNVECFTHLDTIPLADTSYCLLQAGPHLALTDSVQVQDLYQQTSAQYALLNSK